MASYEDSLVNSQRNSEASILIQKRNSDVNFLLEDGDEEGRGEREVTTLQRRHKGAIRAIRKLQYLVAKRKFREALKPYDIKDVIESYSAGHSDLVFKVKGLQSRLDLILGQPGSKSKHVYDSKTSLASRIVNVERMVDSIEEKLQIFIELYQEDRKRFQRSEDPGSGGSGGGAEGSKTEEGIPVDSQDSVEVVESMASQDSLEVEDTTEKFASLPQGLELFTIVTEQQKTNSVYHRNKLNSYNL